MKKKITFSVLLLSLLVLGACGETTPSESLSDSSSNDISSTSTSESSTNTSSEEEIEISDISSLRALGVGQEATVRGVVVNHNYSGQTTPYIVGFWIADLTGSVYVYGVSIAESVTKGNTVTLTGTKSYYIPENDVSSATAVGYIGMLQLSNPVLLDLDESISGVPEGVIHDTTIAAISNIPLTEDITGNIYRVEGRYRRYDETSYVNYGIDDLNRVDSLLAYTQCNGKDYYWTDEYENDTVEMLIIISLGKPAVGLWRMNPIAFLDDEVVVTALAEAEYGAERALSAFAETYNIDTRVNVAIADPLLEGMTRAFSSLSNIVAISQVGSDNVVDISVDEAGTLEITATAYYGGQSAIATKTITIEEPEEIDALTLAEAKAHADGDVVTVEAIVARVTYKSSMTKQGLFLIDETDTLFVYNSAATQANLVDIVNGNKVIVTGTIAHFIKDAANAASENYAGDFQLTEVTVDQIDTNVYELPTAAIIESTIVDIATTLPSTNISSNVYRVAALVVKNASQYATSYDLVSISDASKKLPLYSQNSGSDFSWLDEYANQQVYVYVGIQNLNLKSAGSNWRGLPIQVLGPVSN